MTHLVAVSVLGAAAVPDFLRCGSSCLLYREQESVLLLLLAAKDSRNW